MELFPILDAFITHFRTELNGMIQSAKTAHEAATHEESKAEDRHDTFAIEAGYLAAGQAQRAAELERIISEFEMYKIKLGPTANTPKPEGVAGSLITLVQDGKTLYSFLALQGGGVQVKVDGKTITVVTRNSPLGEWLFHAKPNETFTLETKNGAKEYEVLSIL